VEIGESGFEKWHNRGTGGDRMKKVTFSLMAALSVCACAGSGPKTMRSTASADAGEKICSSKVVYDGQGRFLSCDLSGSALKNGHVVLTGKDITELGCNGFCQALRNPEIKHPDFLDTEKEIEQ
jgi:hypothetical protein